MCQAIIHNSIQGPVNTQCAVDSRDVFCYQHKTKQYVYEAIIYRAAEPFVKDAQCNGKNKSRKRCGNKGLGDQLLCNAHMTILNHELEAFGQCMAVNFSLSSNFNRRCENRRKGETHCAMHVRYAQIYAEMLYKGRVHVAMERTESIVVDMSRMECFAAATWVNT
jgi:hypothetical protein